jgi:hypothetical protein
LWPPCVKEEAFRKELEEAAQKQQQQEAWLAGWLQQ